MTTITRPLETGFLDDTPVDDTLLRRFLHNQADLVALIAAAGGGTVVRRRDLVVGAFDTPVAYQNMAVLLRPLDDELADAVDDAFGDRHGMVLSAWPTADQTGRGWGLVGHPTFVVRGPQAAAAVPAVVRRVTTPEELALAEQVVAEGYPVPEAIGAAPGSAYPRAVLGSALQVFLGSYGGETVAAAASHEAHGVLNLCMAATLPAARRHGVWEALAQTRLAQAPHLPAAAVTSDYSRKGFEKLGFQPVTRCTLWLR
ncbi:MAG: GNAT family N-acetyltransferase [Actinomycetota bacterium]|nr:GNAT family N-acetyltransferase [Actinomycetota bacterium]